MQRTPRTWLPLLATLSALTLAACHGEPTRSPLEPTSSAFAKNGNSTAAQACQQGGYLNLFRSDGTGFKNAGECTSYAAQGGAFVTRVTVSFSNIVLSACNSLTYGYSVDGQETDVATKPDGCATRTVADHSIQVLSSQTVLVYLRDNKCGVTYYEGGIHSGTGTNPGEIGIADAGFVCEMTNVTRQVYPSNLSVTKTVS